MGGGGGGGVKSQRVISAYLYTSVNCKLLIKRYLQAFNGQSFIVFTVSFIMHITCIQLISTSIYCTEKLSKFLKIKHIFNSILPSGNLP